MGRKLMLFFFFLSLSLSLSFTFSFSSPPPLSLSCHSDAILAAVLIPAVTLLLLLNLIIVLSFCCLLKTRRKAKVHADTATSVLQTQIARDTWQYVAGPPPPTYTEACVQGSDDNNDTPDSTRNSNQDSYHSTMSTTVGDDESTQLSNSHSPHQAMNDSETSVV